MRLGIALISVRLGIALISVSLHYEWRAMEIAIHERVFSAKDGHTP